MFYKMGIPLFKGGYNKCLSKLCVNEQVGFTEDQCFGC